MEWVAWVAWVAWVEWECNTVPTKNKIQKGQFLLPFFFAKIISVGGMIEILGFFIVF